jgi:hypothetical protein
LFLATVINMIWGLRQFMVWVGSGFDTAVAEAYFLPGMASFSYAQPV